jgi:phosphonate transport system substrate-binding protein
MACCTGGASRPAPHSHRIAMNLQTASSLARRRRAIVQSFALLSLGATILIGAPPARAQGGVLRVSAIPDEAPSELQRKFKPLGDYLKARTGMDVQFTPVTDYAAVVEGLAAKKIDLAWLGGFTFVQARLRTEGQVVPIVQRAEDEKFTSKFIVPLDSPIKSVADIKGHTFVFGAPSSTSGSLMPRYFLQQQGIVPERDFRTVAFSGAHDATVAFVASGRAEAGVLNASVMDKLVEAKNPNAEKVRVLATTPTFYDYNWTVRPGLDPALQKKLTDAFLALDPSKPADKEILDLQRASRFIPTKASNYDGIETAGKAAGLIK